MNTHYPHAADYDRAAALEQRLETERARAQMEQARLNGQIAGLRAGLVAALRRARRESK